MKSANTWGLVIILLLAVGTLLQAQETPETTYQAKTVVLPFASYTPETRLMFGGMLMHQFKPRSAGAETRASQLLTSAFYTLNKQVIVEFIPIVILPQEKWLLDGVYQYAYFPDRYWGVGPHTRGEDELSVEYSRFNFQQTILRKVSDGLYAGPRLRWSRLSNIEFTDSNDELVPPEDIEGAERSTLPGVGFSIRWDKRNSITAPAKNHYLELTTLFYPKMLGASHPHQSWQLDG